MQLAQPTDFEILEALSDGRRNTAANLSHIIDKKRTYINTRLPLLADYGLVERVGPAPNSGLYQITSRGEIALDLRGVYDADEQSFESRLEERLKGVPPETAPEEA
jgi:predicted transcriptional regulator